MREVILYRVLFTNITINGNQTISTKWYENDYECDKWMSKLDAKIEIKEVVKDERAKKTAMYSKFNNN